MIALLPESTLNGWLLGIVATVVGGLLVAGITAVPVLLYKISVTLAELGVEFKGMREDLDKAAGSVAGHAQVIADHEGRISNLEVAKKRRRV